MAGRWTAGVVTATVVLGALAWYSQPHPAVRAIQRGDIPRMAALIQDGFDVNCVISMRDQYHRCMTPVMWAIEASQPEMLRFLSSRGATLVSPPCLRQHSYVYWSLFKHNPQCLAALLESGAPLSSPDLDHKVPLIMALEGRQTEATLILISHGADIDPVDENGNTPVSLACGLLQNEDLKDVITALLNRGLPPNSPVGGGWERDRTLLMWAAEFGPPSLVRSLLAFGADPELVDSKGRKAVDFARQRSDGHMDDVADQLGVSRQSPSR
jgi:hypothetical protein